ncbi:MAG: 3-oxoacyl-[acyl-carrier-protein] reductase [Candidatus Omnitrophica bacterium]|nr:3-oxoacyl-[acyl-carrier-protein] reductase [Candidatus Omnitrophota bacterium]MCK5180806.1 3-oxoacyl-[acyl-carrier-protein] reductase [Candidatus Omnitrophota bacterium]MCK5260067.1 3-oxoacyl-[acyl-carrier-protein] reductase [Candidatus Omnitrophota bacterium]
MRFKDAIVMVTGSSRGIGKEIAQAFAEEGAAVMIIDVNAELAEETKNEFTGQGLKAESFCCDVTNLQNVQEMVTKILDKYKRVDILVNNAGITKDNLLLRMSETDWDTVVNVNLRGPFVCTKAVTKTMMKARKGRIINIASIIGIRGNAGQANYAATKAGVIGFTKSIARELASRGITANAIAPGYIQTAMTAKLDDTVREALLKQIPLGLLGTAKDVAGACLFLASNEASYITGQTIVVDGGMAI